MGRFSVSVDDDVVEAVNEYAEEHHGGVRSHAVEELLRKGLAHDDVVDDLEAEIEHAEAKADDLRRQLSALQERQDDVGELARYVDEERTYRRAGLATRAKWWLLGMDVDEDSDR